MDDIELQIEAVLRERVRKCSGNDLSSLLMRKFPCASGRIDWRRAKNVVFKPAPPARVTGANTPGGAFQTAEYVHQVSAFLDECWAAYDVADEWVAFVGDSMCSEYEVMRLAVSELLCVVSEVPDHKYVFALDGTWCFMWSFEDDMYFGWQP
jgi:hypothetical protein